MEASAAEVRLANHESRLNANHDSLAKIRDVAADHETRISVITTELRETREDVADIKKVVEDEGKRNRASNNRVVWALVGLALSAAGSAITVALTLGGHP
jgi:septal ring factor EnvC (AmiA/AmiB activator)